MNTPHARRWFQFHLATLFLAMALLACFLWLNLHPRCAGAYFGYRGPGIGLYKVKWSPAWPVPWRAPRAYEIDQFFDGTTPTKPIEVLPEGELTHALMYQTEYGWPWSWHSSIEIVPPPIEVRAATPENIMAAWKPSPPGEGGREVNGLDTKVIGYNAGVALGVALAFSVLLEGLLRRRARRRGASAPTRPDAPSPPV